MIVLLTAARNGPGTRGSLAKPMFAGDGRGDTGVPFQTGIDVTIAANLDLGRPLSLRSLTTSMRAGAAGRTSSMSCRVIALANQKGGVGKTTTAINLGAALARRGQRVLIFDFDPQANSSAGLGIRTEGLSTYEVVVGGAHASDAVVATTVDNLSLVPAT